MYMYTHMYLDMCHVEWYVLCAYECLSLSPSLSLSLPVYTHVYV